jgi:hypothetical protein
MACCSVVESPGPRPRLSVGLVARRAPTLRYWKTGSGSKSDKSAMANSIGGPAHSQADASRLCEKGSREDRQR